jgi:hypothetical protein
MILVREVLEFLQVDRPIEFPARGGRLGPLAEAERARTVVR